MGGMAGWIDYQRDLTPARDIVATMAGRVAWRGPGGYGIWSSPRAVIGHHRLALVDVEGGAQPFVVEEDGRPLVVIALDGDIHNHRELRAALKGHGHDFRTSGEAEVVARAYLEWGTECVSRLDGVFAIAIWDVRGEELLLVGDRLGLRSIYYQPTPTGVLFGSEPKALLAHPEIDAVVEEDGLRDALSFTVVPGRSVYKDMRRLNQGHLVRITAGGVKEQRYWTLEAAPHPDSAARTAATWRELLEAAVHARLDVDVPVGVLLSGGVDSSALVALATRAIRERGGPALRTFTLDFAGTQTGPGLLQVSRDAPHAAMIAREFGTDHTEIVVDRAELEDPVLQRTMVAAQQDRPTPTSDFAIALRHLCRTVSSSAPVVLSGQQAGLMFGGALGMSDEQSTGSATFPWISFTQRRTHRSGIGTGLLAPDLLERLDLPGYCARRYRETVEAVPVVKGETGPARRARELRYLSLYGWHEYVTVFDTGLTQTAGLSARWPYCTPEMIQYCFNIPYDMKGADGGPLNVAAAALRDDLPEPILNRTPSPFPIGAGPHGGAAMRERLATLIKDGGSPALDLIDVAAARELLDSPPRPERAWRDRTDIHMVLQLDAWLGGYRVRLV